MVCLVHKKDCLKKCTVMEDSKLDSSGLGHHRNVGEDFEFDGDVYNSDGGFHGGDIDDIRQKNQLK